MLVVPSGAVRSMDKFRVVFWDFDGVIKDSVEVKSNAFEQMFESFGDDVAKKVRSHHESNGGMSRFDKLPLYLKWSGQSPSEAMIDEYSKRFSNLVKQKVIESEWVPGVLDYIQHSSKRQTFFLVTATPQPEIEEILRVLRIKRFFRKVIGAPTKKGDAIRMLLAECSVTWDQAMMVGDSSSDYEAASVNHITFVLRRTNLNQDLQDRLTCPMINDFCYE
jgi:phosphoglycolate phosphatase-like HAD superfamily hydrolase